MPDVLGFQNILESGLSGEFPASFAETPAGTLLIANGIDPVLKWEPFKTLATTVGVRAPASAPELGGLGTGTIAGQYVCFVRYIDGDGNPSCLSPASNAVDTGTDGWIEGMTGGASVLVRSAAHGRTTGDPVVISGVEGAGLAAANGTWAVTVVDEDTFTIPLNVPTGKYLTGGTWTYGIATIVYGAVPVPAEAKVVRRQVLRNLGGNADVLYVDIDTTDLTSTAFTSTRTDEELATQEAVPLTYGEDDLPYANRFGVPPAHKAVVVVHQGRAFLMGDVVYRDGHAEAAFGSTKVLGVGTHWPASFAGRVIYIDGASRPYEVASVDVAAQELTLATPFADAHRPFAAYAIRPAPAERRLVYYCEPGTTEAWPPYNAVAVPEDSDEIVGGFVKGSYVYICEQRHIYRLTFQEDPVVDGFIFLANHRGCVNNRCHVTVEGRTYMLDEAGVHAFDGEQTEPVSDAIQVIFQVDGTSDFQVDWAGDQRLWHAAHDPVRNTIRWFVSMLGQPELRHALCYNYRQSRWWVEEYPTAITSSCVATIGYRRSLAGTEARRVLVLAEGSYDGVDSSGTLRGTVTSSDAAVLTDADAAFAALEGAPVTIVDGLGRGQTRVIASNTGTTIYVRDPWTVVPGVGSVYQVGGIGWDWRSGWFEFADDEAENVRDVQLVYEPVAVPCTVDMRLYYDHDASPRVWDYTQADDGRSVVAGSPFIAFHLDERRGYMIQRLTGHADTYAQGDQFLSIRLSGVQAGDPVRIHEVTVGGVSEH